MHDALGGWDLSSDLLSSSYREAIQAPVVEVRAPTTGQFIVQDVVQQQQQILQQQLMQQALQQQIAAGLAYQQPKTLRAAATAAPAAACVVARQFEGCTAAAAAG